MANWRFRWEVNQINSGELKNNTRMMNKRLERQLRKAFPTVALTLCTWATACFTLSAQQISDYNVVWDIPSEHSGGSMPLGNGELGMNVWVEKGGDLLFYLSRTDAMSEANRLMKLGRIRVKLTPNPFREGMPFTQKLLLDEGCIEISAGSPGEEVIFKLFMDPAAEVAYLTYDGQEKRQLSVTAESWRREPHVLQQGESLSAWTTQPLPADLKITESADVFLPEKGALSWYHANESSVYDLTMRHQGKEALSENFPNPITGRIFGVYVTGEGLTKANDSMFVSPSATRKAALKIATHSAQVKSPAEWKKQLLAAARHSSATTAFAASRKWWGDFWRRSYIYVDIPSDPAFGHSLTQAYILQRYMAAGSGRGHFPIKFNGSIFTTDPKYTNAASDYSPDFRNWGNEFWWQNTRLPYYAMLSAGDFDLMPPLFDFYLQRMDAFRTLATTYYGAKGIFIPETVTLFGTYANGDWGWDRTGHTPKEVQSPYLRYIWVQGLELSKIMLDYFAYTGDTTFLSQQALPAIREVMLYFDSRFLGDKEKMQISPTQSLETYWFNVVNDMPSVAGLHAVLATLETLPEELLTAEDRAYYLRLKRSLPALPSKNTAAGPVFLPAQEYLEKQSNVENPEMYPVFPFGLANLTNKLKETAVRSYERRQFDSGTGWGQDGQLTAMLGLVEPTVENLRVKVRNTNSNHRFPAMWGPNYDWVPDQDHGSNLLMTLQYMVLQNYEGKAYLLPTWPTDWNVTFRLAATGKTVVEGTYKGGNLTYKQEGLTPLVPMK